MFFFLIDFREWVGESDDVGVLMCYCVVVEEYLIFEFLNNYL